MGTASQLFTIGYERTAPQALFDELQRAGVKLVADVRAVVSSRRPGFSKNQLAAALDQRGIGYLHLRDLGTPKEGRNAARGGDFAALRHIYSTHLKTPQASEQLDALEALINSTGPVCLLCFEYDHQHCHRQWIAERMAARRPVTVYHLQPQQGPS